MNLNIEFSGEMNSNARVLFPVAMHVSKNCFAILCRVKHYELSILVIVNNRKREILDVHHGSMCKQRL